MFEVSGRRKPIVEKSESQLEEVNQGTPANRATKVEI